MRNEKEMRNEIFISHFLFLFNIKFGGAASAKMRRFCQVVIVHKFSGQILCNLPIAIFSHYGILNSERKVFISMEKVIFLNRYLIVVRKKQDMCSALVCAVSIDTICKSCKKQGYELLNVTLIKNEIDSISCTSNFISANGHLCFVEKRIFIEDFPRFYNRRMTRKCFNDLKKGKTFFVLDKTIL